MPASLFPDMDRNNSGLEDQRALQLAFELSMLGLSDASTTTEHETLNTTFADEARGKKSQNMTECVPVPSSEHVAEIVGRQGCKIKALRAKTNTYIKTPVRGEEPVFVVTGRKEDVAKAKREILSAAEHFSQIRASRKSTLGGGGVGGVGGGVGTGGGTVPGPPANVPGHVTIQVRVPYRVVGLVVGPKGATIKRIQHQTHTYIVTPSRDKEPVFEVTGLPESVEAARKEIEAHIAVRTGGGVGGGAVPCGGGGPADFAVDDAVDVGRGGMVGEEILASLYKNGLGFLYPNIKACNDLASRVCGKLGRSGGDGSPFARAPPDVAFPSSLLDSTPLDSVLFPSEFSSSLSGGGSSSSSSSSSSSTSGGITATSGNFGTSGTPWGGLDRDEGLGESPSFEGPPSGPWSDLKSGNAGRFSPTIVNGTEPTSPHLPARRVGSDPLGVTAVGTSVSPTDSVGSLASIGSGGAAPGGGRRECVVCCEREVVAALVPCGHNLFCMECGQRVCSRADAHCPVCQHPVKQAIRIFS